MIPRPKGVPQKPAEAMILAVDEQRDADGADGIVITVFPGMAL